MCALLPTPRAVAQLKISAAAVEGMGEVEAVVVIVEEAAGVWARNQQRQHYRPHRIP